MRRGSWGLLLLGRWPADLPKQVAPWLRCCLGREVWLGSSGGCKRDASVGIPPPGFLLGCSGVYIRWQVKESWRRAEAASRSFGQVEAEVSCSCGGPASCLLNLAPSRPGVHQQARRIQSDSKQDTVSGRDSCRVSKGANDRERPADLRGCVSFVRRGMLRVPSLRQVPRKPSQSVVLGCN